MKRLFMLRGITAALVLMLLGAVSVLADDVVTGGVDKYKLIAPDLVSQGETFTGKVVEETPKGDVPLEGGGVLFQGQVIPIEPGGKITLPAFTKDAGSAVVAVQVLRSAAGSAATTLSRDVEVLPVAANVPTRLAQASSIVSPGEQVWGTGQGLKVVKAALVDQSGGEHALGNVVGSSLQAGGTAPANLAPGTYRFVAWDAAGNRVEAPNTSKCPTLKLEGSRITHRGQRGTITVLSDTDGTVLLSGGEPQIVLDERTISVGNSKAASVKFVAQQVGDYTVNARLFTLDGSLVPAEDLRVEPKLEPLQSRYDAATHQTQASIGVRVVDDAGRPVANAPVDIALAHPNGVEYGRVITNQQGHARFAHTLAGQVVTESLSAIVYRVPGYRWQQDDKECDCIDLKAKFNVRYDPKGDKGGHAGVAASVTKDRKKKDTVNVEVAVLYLAQLECDDTHPWEHCLGEIKVTSQSSDWKHQPDAGVAVHQGGKDVGVDPKAWEATSPSTESVDANLTKLTGKCMGKNPPKEGKAVYKASFSAANTNIRGKVTITLTPICKDKELTPIKISVFVDGSNVKLGFDPDNSDYTGDGKANKDKPKK